MGVEYLTSYILLDAESDTKLLLINFVIIIVTNPLKPVFLIRNILITICVKRV